MGTLVIVYLAFLFTFLHVSAEDTGITLKSARHGTITYGILDTEGSVLAECFLERVNEKVYQLYPEKNVTNPNIFYTQLNSFQCAFEIKDVNVDSSGKWKLKAIYLGANSTVLSTLEKPFNIIIEEEVPMIPQMSVTVYQGETLYIRLSEIPPNIQSCEVVEGSGQSEQRSVVDLGDNCSVTFRDFQPGVKGVWTFKAHGDVLTLWGQLNITVIAPPRVNTSAVNLKLGSSAILKFGPKDATYCEAADPTGLVHVMQYGQCSFKLPIATTSHRGEWKVRAAIPGKTTSDIYNYTVNVEESNQGQINPDTVVPSVVVSDDKRTLSIKCSLMVPTINGCRLIRSDGKSFTHGFIWNEATLEEEQFTFDEEQFTWNNGTYTDSLGNIIIDCGVQVQHAVLVDLLPWKCIMRLGSDDREVGTYIDVLQRDDPFLADHSNNTDVDLEKQDTVVQMQGKSFEVKCSLPRQLDYCWFRTPNTKQLVPIPGAINPAYEYVGSGLGLGECGIRIKNATSADSGTWSCNMGSYTDQDLKQKTRVIIYRSGVRGSFQFQSPNAVSLTCSTLEYSSLDYCRFVRPDGLGINPMYTNGSSYNGNQTRLSTGICKLYIPDMAYEDFGTWTCAGKPTNIAEEYQETMHLYKYVYFGSRRSTWFPWTLYFIFTLGMAVMMVSIVQRTKMGVLLKQRTRKFRQSFRNRENQDLNEIKSAKQIEAESQI